MTGAAEGIGPPGAVDLATVQRRLTLLAQALVGEDVELIDASLPSDASSDARLLVRLPASIAVFPTVQGNVAAYRVAVLRGVGRLEFASAPPLDPAAASYDALPERTTVAWLLDVLEARRIDAALGRRYPGARSDLALVRGAQRRALAPLEDATARRRVLGAVRVASLGASDAEVADHVDAAAPLETDVLAEALIAASAVDDPEATAGTSESAAVRITALLRQLGVGPGVGPGGIGTDETNRDQSADDDLDDIDDIDAADDVQPTGDHSDEPTWPSEGDEPAEQPESPPSFDDLESTLRAELGIDADLPDDVLPELADHRLGGGTIDVEVRAVTVEPSTPRADLSRVRDDERRRAAHPAWTGPGAAGTGARSFTYDEWDYRGGQYLRAWCTLHERRLHGEELDYLARILRRHGGVAAQVRRHFAFARPHAFHRVRHVDDGDELDLDALIEARVDRRAGRSGDDRHHVRRQRARRDVAAAFLIDMSSSTSTPVPDKHAPPPPPPPPVADDETLGPYLRGSYWDDPEDWPPPTPGESVLDLAKSAMAIVGVGLEQLGDAYAVYGFSGRGRDNVEFHVGKEFDEAPSRRTWSAVAAMQPLGYTRMGPAIRHAASKLAAQPEATKLLVVLSDGYPQDQDYGPDWRDHDYGLHDTAKALQEAAALGLSSFCITVDPAGHDYLRRMCEVDRYLVIEELADLPRELARVYRTLSGLGAS